MEKIFRWADNNGVNYEKVKDESIVANIFMPIEVKTGEPKVVPLSTGSEDVKPMVAESVTVATIPHEYDTKISSAAEPVWEPGGGAEIETPTPVSITVDEDLSPVESMTQQKLNEILATIPAVEKI